jgi:hypothetical protein
MTDNGHNHLSEEQKAALLARYADAKAADPAFRAKLREMKRRRDAGDLIEENSRIGEDSARARRPG